MEQIFIIQEMLELDPVTQQQQLYMYQEPLLQQVILVH
jgi:hypothetical protein